MRRPKSKCWFCRPVIITREGADHVGLDAFMRCEKCGWRTMNHVECVSVTPNVRAMLSREWRGWRGELTPEPFQ